VKVINVAVDHIEIRHLFPNELQHEYVVSNLVDAGVVEAKRAIARSHEASVGY
jgi:hypothetical protein